MKARRMRLVAGIAAIGLSALFCVTPAGAEILFIGGQAGPTQGDDGDVFAHLEDRGYDVTYMQASQSSTADGRNVDLIILSSTPGSGDMRGKFQDLPTPILNWEEAIMRWNATPDGHIRTAEISNNGGTQTTDLVNIVNPDHCLAAGLPAGEIYVADTFISMPNSYGELAEGTIVIAEMDPAVAVQDPAEAVLTAIETGGLLGPNSAGARLPSPGPRVNFFVVDTGFSSLNENGLALFDAAVEWLVNGGKCANGGGGEPELQAGDADMNYEFNQLDLVKVQIAAKYLTGAAATWGDGDWNGAPGGTAGSPPAGNGLFDQLDIIAALTGGKYLAGPYAALAGPGDLGDGQTSLVYNAGTGELSVDAPAGQLLTSINIDSAGKIFTGDPAGNLGGSFDNDADGNIFKATFGSSFGSLSFGNVAQAGLSQEFLLNDLTAVGSLAGGGALGNVDLVYVPEPSALVLLALGLVGLLATRRRR